MDFLFPLKSNLFLEFLYTLFTLYILSYSLTSQVYELRLGKLFTFIVIPWVTTGPETVTAVVMLLKGYPVACLFNCVYSAIFDLFLVMPIIAISYRIRTHYMIAFDEVGVRQWILTIIPCVALATFGIDLKINTLHEGVILTALVALTVLPYLWYRGVTKFTISTITEESPFASPSKFIGYVTNLIITLYAFAVTSWYFGNVVSEFAKLLPQDWVGVMSAYLTSLPDAFYAWSIPLEEIEDALGEIWSCVIHDYTEGIGIPVLASVVAKTGIALTFTFIEYLIAISVIIILITLLLIRKFTLDNAFITSALLVFTVYTLIAVAIT